MTPATRSLHGINGINALMTQGCNGICNRLINEITALCKDLIVGHCYSIMLTIENRCFVIADSSC